ncbi:CASP-like protein 1E1 [Dioscorea cayenensis subsp. rotundata]|uniref:CASP-like protein n=1 Tax=Dioscorea cayennensis subsp. rotundata TaxID=55577 RepID=A0AB40BHV2_DIOCR|nr:CASP-like protein 1E1 [Dioscorea cayenensis subsp. rotundata]
MASNHKPGFDGIQAPPSLPQPYTIRPLSSSSSSSSSPLPGYILRGAAVLLTFISAIVMGVAKQTKTITINDPSTLTSQTITGTVKSTYAAAYVYFIIINVLVFVYSAAALAISIANRASSSNLELPFNIADLLVAILLFSCNSAASNTSVIASNGSDRLGWTKICDIVGSFCGQATAAIVLSMFAALAYVLLVVLGIINLHKRSL